MDRDFSSSPTWHIFFLLLFNSFDLPKASKPLAKEVNLWEKKSLVQEASFTSPRKKQWSMTCVVEYHRPKDRSNYRQHFLCHLQILQSFPEFFFLLLSDLFGGKMDGNVGSFDWRHDTGLDTLIDESTRGWQSFQPSNRNRFSVISFAASRKWRVWKKSIFEVAQ